jgi:hypothetical protein
MFSALGKRIHVTPATVIASLALVFAMTGGAYAASKYLITSTKQISPKVLKSLKGAKGANGTNGTNGPAGAAGAGSAGAAGPAGPQGPAGNAGTNGTNGTNGEKGKEGSPWTADGTLPKGKTETGAWSYVSYETTSLTSHVLAPISFPIPLTAELGETEVHYLGQTGNGTTCLGTVEKPTAEPGNLCVYTKQVSGVIGVDTEIFSDSFVPKIALGHAGAGTSGAVIIFHVEKEETGSGWGSWAVTEKP